MTDSICLLPATPVCPGLGAYDPNLPSLAVVVGETFHGFGDRSGCEPLTVFLSDPKPIDFAELQITAAPARSVRDPAYHRPALHVSTSIFT